MNISGSIGRPQVNFAVDIGQGSGVSGLGGRMGPSAMRGQGPPSAGDLKQAMETLKSSNPELAEKLGKIQTRMEELGNAGTNPMEAFKAIEKEFGSPSDKELSQMQSLFGDSGGMGISGRPGSGGFGLARALNIAA